MLRTSGGFISECGVKLFTGSESVQGRLREVTHVKEGACRYTFPLVGGMKDASDAPAAHKSSKIVALLDNMPVHVHVQIYQQCQNHNEHIQSTGKVHQHDSC
jgi:hypothetical protein